MKAKIVAVIIGLAAITGGVYTIMSLTSVGQGEVGVVWSMKDGVQEEVLDPGVHFVGPFDKVKDYPVSQQQLVLSNNPEDYNKKHHADWHIDAPADGGIVAINMTVNYNFIADRVIDLYEKFNGMDGDAIVESMVQNSIIAYVKEVTPQFTVMDIYSTKRSEVSKEITKYLNDKLSEEYGINISSALIIDVQLDDALKEKVQAKEQAKQDAEKAELDKQTALAQAEVAKANAEAAAEVKRIEAQADADEIRIAAEAEAEANQKLAGSITEELIRMKEAEARLKHGWVTVKGAEAVVAE